MGMDVIGKKPSSKEGEYFRNNIAGWHPLASFLQELEPDICEACEHWHTNDGDGLNGEQSKFLAASIRRRLESEEKINLYSHQTWDKSSERVKEDFSRENLEKFATFLENCGGFEIW